MSERAPAGSVVLITGGGSGIGRESALGFARRGARLALLGRRAHALEQVAAEVHALGAQAACMPCDVTAEAQVASALQACLARFGRIDVLINCAGIAGPAVLTHHTRDHDFQELLAVNLTGTFRMIRGVLTPMLGQGSGAIVNVGSSAGLHGMAHMAAYSAAKGGVIALTRAVAAEYGGRGIRCNCICPGPVLTPMTEAVLATPGGRAASQAHNALGRIASAAEIAQTILHLGSPESSFIQGAVIPIDGGHC